MLKSSLLNNLPLFINEKELAELLAVSVSKIRKDRQLGVGVVPCRIGRAVRYHRDNVIAYINALCEEGHTYDC